MRTLTLPRLRACRQALLPCRDLKPVGKRTATLARLGSHRQTHCYAAVIGSQSGSALLRWRDWEAIGRRFKWSVASHTARQRVIHHPKGSGGARFGTLPLEQRVKQSASRRRSDAGATTARPLTCCVPASPRANLSVVVCRTAVVLSIGMR
jgi:hypothetical protein